MNRFRVVVDDDRLRGARNFPDRRPAAALHLAEPDDPIRTFLPNQPVRIFSIELVTNDFFLPITRIPSIG